MVGKKEKKMTYSVAVTSAGQMTIPKVFREMLGITDKVEVDIDKDKIVVKRQKTNEEIVREVMAELDASWTPEQRKAIKENAGKTARQLRAEWEASPEVAEYYREKYGIQG